jgi:hypothetical protein
MIELKGNTKAVFVAIAMGAFATCQVMGPARAASVGALKKQQLVSGEAGTYSLTDVGKALYATMTMTTKSAEKKPAISERSAGYIAEARKKFGSQLDGVDDLTLVSRAQLWRITKPDAALAKVQAVFRLQAA